MLELLLAIVQMVVLPFIVSVVAGLAVRWITRRLAAKRRGLVEADFLKEKQ